MKNVAKQTILFGSLCLSIWACSGSEKIENGKIEVVCTTGMIGDALVNLLDSNFSVVSLMGPGVDPHLYKPTQGDLKKLQRADLIVYNGLHLEGKMQDIFEKLSQRKKVLAFSSPLNKGRLLDLEGEGLSYDPHIWFDVLLWKEACNGISDSLVKLYPSASESIRGNIKKYSDKLENLNSLVVEKINEIPVEQRVMITAHDAFSYFGRAYQIDVMGLQGISTVSEYGIRDVSNLVNFISERKIRSVFVESSISSKSMEAVIERCEKKGHRVKIGGTLYSDAMGEAGSEEGTYLGMVRKNVSTISDGLK